MRQLSRSDEVGRCVGIKESDNRLNPFIIAAANRSDALSGRRTGIGKSTRGFPPFAEAPEVLGAAAVLFALLGPAPVGSPCRPQANRVNTRAHANPLPEKSFRCPCPHKR
jgi:hypothetical protein